MKRFIFILITFLTLNVCYAQDFNRSRMKHFRDVYKQVEVLTLENAPTTFPTENNDYLIELPKATQVVIAYNEDKSNAIIISMPGYPFYKHMEYNVNDNEKRLVLWYKDDHLYCGYTYDKKSKAGKYFEAIDQEEKDKLVKKIPFLKNIPTFN